MNPYENLPSKAFWKLSVAGKSMFEIDKLWDPKFNIRPNQNIVTFGSCFAQHIGNALRASNFCWLNTEPSPPGLSDVDAKLFNYNIFSARTGNIYTTSLLLQWTKWALGKSHVPGEIWKKDSRFYDPFRPRIEPNGFASGEEMKQSQAQAIGSFLNSINRAHYFLFTLGLTESWINTAGYEYPVCPGILAGDFEPQNHRFRNQQFHEVLRNLRAAILMMRKANPHIKFILTVSPVPLTATQSNNHILVATMESKSILRAVAGQLATNYSYIDYFPSYEIINSPIFKGVFFSPNQRNINPFGISFVMDSFFKSLENKFGGIDSAERRPPAKIGDVEEGCDEELMEAFAKK